MLVTVTNLTSDEVVLPYPFNAQSHHFVKTENEPNSAFNTVKAPRTLAPAGDSGDAVTLGVTAADLERGIDQGDEAHKSLQKLVNEGTVSVAIAVDPNDNSVLDDANEVA